MAFSDQINGPFDLFYEIATPDSASFASINHGSPLRTDIEVGLMEGENVKIKIEDSQCKVDLPPFPTDRPWLPPKALAIIDKIKKGAISENDATTLMQLVADQVIEHFQLESGRFFASTFSGRIVEIANTRIELLKKIQGQDFREQIFVWRVGADSFSGRL